MNSAADLQEPVDTLLDLLEQQARERCETIRRQGHEQARERIRSAYREARERVHQSIQEERTRGRQRVNAARAQLETRNRQTYQEAVMQTLQRAWHRLHAALGDRWGATEGRRQWVALLITRGLETLPMAPWRIEHPTGWDSGELAPWLARITAHAGTAPECVPVPATAGLRVCAASACLDGTLEGLLAKRGEVEARLLAQLESAMGDRS